MTDDELEARLRKLSARPDKDERFWDELAGSVRTAYERTARNGPSEPRRRRRPRWIAAPLAGGLALAAAFTLYVRAHQLPPTPSGDPLGDETGVLGDVDTGEMIEELDPAQLDRVALAFKRGV